MPQNKDLKRLVRSRMVKTGESYTTARARLVAKKGAAKQGAAEPAMDLASVAGMSDEAVKAKTGCDWARWVWWLDRKDAASLPHKEIARLIDESFDFGGWWAQSVAVGYERIKGLREISQRRDGAYEATKSKIFPVPIAELYRAWSDPRRRQRWLGEVEMAVRKATPRKSMRLDWGDGTKVQVYFWVKGEAKSQVAIQHTRLGSGDEIDRVKGFWAERLEALSQVLG